jgi:hypothetical protein
MTCDADRVNWSRRGGASLSGACPGCCACTASAVERFTSLVESAHFLSLVP